MEHHRLSFLIALSSGPHVVLYGLAMFLVRAGRGHIASALQQDSVHLLVEKLVFMINKSLALFLHSVLAVCTHQHLTYLRLLLLMR